MSELIQKNDNGAIARWKLLASASVLALTASVLPIHAALADDASNSRVWIELGSQFERIENNEPLLDPLFFDHASPAVLTPLTGVQRPSLYSIAEDLKVAFAPGNSNWLFSASIRYGRSNRNSHQHYQSSHTTLQTFRGVKVVPYGRPLEEFSDGRQDSNSSHLVLDFQAGKDVGLGLFGANGSSIVSVGVRFAQFTSGAHGTFLARPQYRSGPFVTRGGTNPLRFHGAYFHDYTATLQSKRNTHAIGPSLSWDASMPFAGSASNMELTLDWGANAAVLFGRQRARVNHQTTGAYLYDYPGGYYASKLSGYKNQPVAQNRSHSIVVPNAGGFLGMSLKFPNAKVSVGYRGDFFFGAMDNGIDARKSTTLGFYGPFATISIGLGG